MGVSRISSGWVSLILEQCSLFLPEGGVDVRGELKLEGFL
jgi:hypothetical protein